MAATKWTKSRCAPPPWRGELIDGNIREYEIHPKYFGLQMTFSRSLKFPNSAESKAKIFEALDNTTGPARAKLAQFVRVTQELGKA